MTTITTAEVRDATPDQWVDIRERLEIGNIALYFDEALRWSRVTHSGTENEASPNFALYCGEALGKAQMSMLRLDQKREAHARAVELLKGVTAICHLTFACAHHRLLTRIAVLEARVKHEAAAS